MTRLGIVIALVLNVAFVVTSLIVRGQPLVVTTVSPRLAITLLVTTAMVISVGHGMIWQSNRPS